MSSEQQEWEARYQAADTPWDKGEPAPGLVDFLAQTPATAGARVVVPGCGAGEDLLAWARAGCYVTGYDLAPSAVRLSLERVLKAGVDRHVNVVEADFLRIPVALPFDLCFEHTFFSALPPADRPLYFAAVRDWVRTGGELIGIYFEFSDATEPPFGIPPDQLKAELAPWFDLTAEWRPRCWPNRTGEEWMFRFQRTAEKP